MTQWLYLDINRAGVQELSELYGIGEVIAERIVNYRLEHGGFSDITEIMNVEGIGEKTFEGIREHIYVTDEYMTQEQIPETDGTEYREESYPSEGAEEIYEDITEAQTFEKATPGIININTATAEDFMTLPGIDSQLAENIVELRTSIHYFQHIYELLYAEGMTKEKLSAIQNYLTV
jgi:competence ComEA-like helix-hairpin-helix protein